MTQIYLRDIKLLIVSSIIDVCQNMNVHLLVKTQNKDEARVFHIL
jgi:hypothetical protein